MWSLFGLLAVGGAIVVKYINDSSTTEAFNNKRKKADAINRELEITIEEANDLDKQFRDYNSRWNLLLSVDDELNYVYGCQWRKIFENSDYVPAVYSELNTVWGVAFQLVCAKNGKIGLNQKNYQLTGNPELCKIKVKACEMIEKYIRDVNQNLELVFVPGWKILSSREALSYHDEICGGKLWWKHNLPPMRKEQNLCVRKLW